MTDKCWFVLRHQHYPPPKLPSNGFGIAEGPICLGHLIPDLKHLDNVINSKGPEEFPPDMPIYKRTTQEFWRSAESGEQLAISAEANLPVAAVMGVDVNLNTEKAFQKSVRNAWRFETLDTFIVQVTPAYVEDSMDAPEVLEYRKRHEHLGIPRLWESMFMITGLMIARGAKSSSLEQRMKGVGIAMGSDIPGVAGAQTGIDVSSSGDANMTAERADDFVWAIRLAKVTRSLIDRDWSYHTLSSGATFDIGVVPQNRIDVADRLDLEGLNGHEVVPDNKGEEFFVLA